MAHGDINMMAGCDRCTYADSWGRGCSHSLMLPVIIALSGNKCDKFAPKTNEQIELQIQETCKHDKKEKHHDN